MLQICRTAPLALLAVGLVAGCDRLGTAPIELHHELNAETLTTLEDFPASQPKLLGALEMLFGTPSAPAFSVTEEWVDEGYDPNYPVDMGEISEEEFARIQEGNRHRFRVQLAAVDEGRYGDVVLPPWTMNLQR